VSELSSDELALMATRSTPDAVSSYQRLYREGRLQRHLEHRPQSWL